MTTTGLPSYRSPRSLVLSGKVNVPQIFEWNAKENPNYPFYRFHDGQQLHTLSYAQAIQAIRRAARYVKSRIDTPENIAIAILANADTITYSLTSLGILRAGYAMFLISPRNVPAAIVDLLRRTGCRHILVSTDTPIQTLAQSALNDLDGVSLHPMPAFDDLFPKHGPIDENDEPDDLPKVYDWDSTAMILHSSGSTNHPKPIPWTHRRMTTWTTTPWHGEVDITQATLSVHGTPMFHAIGVMMYCLAANNGMPLGVFPPASPPTFPTPDNVFNGIIKTNCEYVMTAPAVIEAWARDPRKVQHMKTMKALIFGGAPLNQEVGDALASEGITLYSCYGSTEVGASARFFPANPRMDWAYFELSTMIKTVQVDAGEGKYELIAISPPECPFPVVNTKVDGMDAYATNDLLVPHPTRKGWWKYYGRLDDQIILSNGEKTNPTPLEDIVNDDRHIRASVMFGQGKFQNGVLIEPMPEHQFDPKDITKLQEYRNIIWPTIERANAFAPQHSRIFKEMILVASPSKPFAYNIKGYPRRPTILKEYHDDIEALYKDVEQSAQSDVSAPATWDAENVRSFLQTVVQKVIGMQPADDTDLFRSGCDSLQATWIRNTILRAIREHSPAAARRMPINIVFQAPSISALTDAVLRTVHSSSSGTAVRTAEELVQLAERYSSELPARPSQLRARESATDVVLITGTTGGFGCDVLEHLLRDERVATVYAFNRHGSQAAERQRVRFRERGLEEALLSSPKFRMVEAALDVPGFDIAPELLDEIRGTLTHIMHNAWTVNFNLALPSFEADLKAVRNLVELSLSSPFATPPRIQLVSSVGVFENCTIQPPVPEVPIPPSSALGSGYAESKWVAEQILNNVADRTGHPLAVVVRLGQVCGNKTGHWNEREWFPALIKSAAFTRCLPDVEGSVSFIPGYPAARAFVELRDSPAPIVHLVHPRPAPWHTLVAPIAEELGVPLVPYAVWLDAVEKTAGSTQGPDADANIEALRENPALRLLDFFRSRSKAAGEGREPLGAAHLSTEKAQGVSDTLAHMPPLGVADAKQWVAAWRTSGFLGARE